MAQINYETSQQIGAENASNSTLPKFFSLRTDGDEAVVRIMHDNTASFEIMTFHEIQTGNGKFRKVNCIRDPREPLENCPLCNSGSKIRQAIFIHMIQYVKNDQGKIVPQAVVWERSISYAEKLKGYIDNYGPLSDIICKIVRHGVAGDRQTTYDIIPNLNKQIYTDAQYPKIENAFDNYKALGTVVLDKDYQDLDSFIRTGQFPVKDTQNTQQAQPMQQIPPVSYQQPNNYQFPAYDTNPARGSGQVYPQMINGITTAGLPVNPVLNTAEFTTSSSQVNNNQNSGIPETPAQIARPIRHY